MTITEERPGDLALFQICPECGRIPKRITAGKCGACYERARHGRGYRRWPALDPEIAAVLLQVPGTSRTFARRVFSNIDASGDCWEWTGAPDSNGYGVIGRGLRGTSDIPAHRAVWQLLVGPIPDGMTYDHLCRNHACVNPDHGEIVTRGVNTMRGYSPSRFYSMRKTCNFGHPLDGIRPQSGRPGRTERYCKTCTRERTAARRAASNKQTR
jgi:hypothetical protein